MLIITHVRLDGPERFYENIAELCCASNSTQSVGTLLSRFLSVADLITEMKNGAMVVTNGDPPGNVEYFEIYGREFIRSSYLATMKNDLLSLPEF